MDVQIKFLVLLIKIRQRNFFLLILLFKTIRSVNFNLIPVHNDFMSTDH